MRCPLSPTVSKSQIQQLDKRRHKRDNRKGENHSILSYLRQVLIRSSGWPGACFVDQAGFALMEICLLLSPACEAQRVCYFTQHISCYSVKLLRLSWNSWKFSCLSLSSARLQIWATTLCVTHVLLSVYFGQRVQPSSSHIYQSHCVLGCFDSFQCVWRADKLGILTCGTGLT